MLRDLRAAAEGDTEDMNRERAETHLRLLAEEELRRAMTQLRVGPAGSQPEDEAVRSASVTGTLAGSAAVPDALMASRGGWGADRAVTELYSMHYRSLVRLTASLVQDVRTAEEVVQDSFVAMLGGWQRLRDADTALAYLSQAVVNRSRSVLRHRSVVGSSLQQVPPGVSGGGYRARVARVAQVLTAVGALDDEVAEQILADFELALATRQAGSSGLRGPGLGSWMRSPAVRPRSAMPVSSRPPTAGMPAAGSGTGTAARRTLAPVPLGQIVRVCGADVHGEVCLLSYARVASGPQFSVFARTRQPSGPWEPAGPRLFDPFTATDDQGTSYQVTIRDIGSPVLGWTLMLRPDPPHDPQWLDLATSTGGGPAARIVLPAAGETRPPASADVTVSQTAPSRGEHLLSTIAARLLAAVPPLPHDPWLYGTAPRPRVLPSITDGLGDVIAALQEAGALPPLSPVPGQLATLCARLNVSGHGITTPPARDLPDPWLSVLTQYQQTETGAAPARDGCAAAAVVLPELDGTQLTILGLHNCEDSTILHMHASGPTCHTAYGPDELYSWPPIWIRDSGGRWHATRISGQSGMDGEIALRLEIVPPLSRATTSIEVRAIGQSAEARARLPLRWQSL